MRLLTIWLGKLLLAAARLRGGGGSALPGLVIGRLRRGLLGELVAGLPDGVVLVTGTNGKTTTTKILSAMLEADGRTVLTNRSGSNMVRGLVSTVLEHSSWGGSLGHDIAVFEVDEPNMPAVVDATGAGHVLVLNLHRDQLDRYGELEHTARVISTSLAGRTAVLNADDPLVAALAETAGQPVRWFGAAAALRAALPDDASLLVGAEGSPDGELRPRLDVTLTGARDAGRDQQVELRIDDRTLTTSLRLPGIYNAYNVAAAVATATALGADPDRCLAAVPDVAPAFGRGEAIDVDGRRLVLQLVKNPSSFTQVLRTQLATGPDRHLLIALNDLDADGRDVSWIWDVDIEVLSTRTDTVLVTGTRAHDMAVRLKYAGLDTIVEPDLGRALDLLVAAVPTGGTGWVLPTYTAMLDMRKHLDRHADLLEMWR